MRQDCEQFAKLAEVLLEQRFAAEERAEAAEARAAGAESLAEDNQRFEEELDSHRATIKGLEVRT